MRYYRVYVEGTNSFYTYCDEREEFEIGDMVTVSFRNRKAGGFIVAKEEEEEFNFKVLPILGKASGNIKLSESFIKLLLWIREYYLAPLNQIFSAAVPKNLKLKFKEVYRLKEDFIPADEEENKILMYLKKKESIGKATLEKNFEEVVIKRLLRAKKIILERAVVQERKSAELIEIENEETVVSDTKKLTEEQEKIKNAIERSKRRYSLIKGVTGSGKTEIYIELIKEAVRRGGGAIFLVPEISLTPQMVKRFKNEFKDSIAILHSRLTDTERAKEWNDLYNGKKKIVLGVRSAIFAPVQNLEYIIIDEEHETSYKQDSAPRYNAKYVGIKRGELENCKVVLGSATPSVESYYYGKKGVFELYTLNERFNNAVLPEVEIVDMRQEEDIFFSKELLKSIKECLLRKEQVMVLLNRKGYSTQIQCKKCGHIEECPHCSIKMNYYSSDKTLKCNYCGISRKFKHRCEKCGSDELIHSGKGVERVEEELKKYFPVNTIRVDAEASKEKDFFKNMYFDFLEGKYDIMIGTQMIAKGLHFPNVTLVGVINADTILNFPDFRAGEKTFQLGTQVAGRAGRGDKRGKVIVQTYQPDNYAIQKISEGDYDGFYEQEIEIREALEYAPFSKIINIGISGTDEEELERVSQSIREKLDNPEVEIYGPMKNMVYKVKDRFRCHIFIKGSRENVNAYKKEIKKIVDEADVGRCRVAIDVDPINLI
jgi:primosomal protein N' (replication factor Y)